MNETINIGLGFSATGWETLLFVSKVVVFFFCIIVTVSVGSSLAIVAGREAAGNKWILMPSNFWKPALLWTLFWILTQIQL